MAWLTKREGESLSGLTLVGLNTYLVGSFGFVTLFLISGAASIPRR